MSTNADCWNTPASKLKDLAFSIMLCSFVHSFYSWFSFYLLSTCKSSFCVVEMLRGRSNVRHNMYERYKMQYKIITFSIPSLFTSE